MTELGTDRVIYLQTLGEVLNALLWRLGLLLIIYQSPDLAQVLLALVK